jgi:hypothetical protein
VLSTPATAAGLAQDPSGSTEKENLTAFEGYWVSSAGKIDNGVATLYDDPADNAAIEFIGVNGTGFDPSSFHTKVAGMLSGAGVAADLSSTDPGPHGGQALCEAPSPTSTLDNSVEVTCMWMTSTTIGGISARMNGGSGAPTIPVTAFGDLMRKIRLDVEHAK